VAGYAPYSKAFIAKNVASVCTQDLYGVYQELSKGRSFGALWNHIYGPKARARLYRSALILISLLKEPSFLWAGIAFCDWKTNSITASL
jgi:hypothetical protein